MLRNFLNGNRLLFSSFRPAHPGNILFYKLGAYWKVEGFQSIETTLKCILGVLCLHFKMGGHQTTVIFLMTTGSNQTQSTEIAALQSKWNVRYLEIPGYLKVLLVMLFFVSGLCWSMFSLWTTMKVVKRAFLEPALLEMNVLFVKRGSLLVRSRVHPLLMSIVCPNFVMVRRALERTTVFLLHQWLESSS